MHYSTKHMTIVECLAMIKPPNNSMVTPTISGRQVSTADGRSIVIYLE
jgi:hypothetical protein